MQPPYVPPSAPANASAAVSTGASGSASGSAQAAAPAPSLSPEVARLLTDTTLPEPVRRFLTGGGELERIVLDDQGQWSHQGEPFLNPALSALFSRSLTRTPGGTWVLYIAPFSYPVQVADTPYYVRSARVAGDAVILGLNDETEERLDPSTLRYVESRGLYCQVKTTTGKGAAAHLLRPAYFALADHISESADGFFLSLGATRIQVPVVSWEQARDAKS